MTVMRIIKFRGQRLNGREWIESMTISNGTIKRKSRNVYFELGDNKWTEINPDTVGQFTGLLDRHGKEIYEGDVVMWGHANEYSRENPIRKAVVKLFPALHFETFTKTEFGCPHELHYGNFAYKDTHKHLEIIGNIHDNPEILKAQ